MAVSWKSATQLTNTLLEVQQKWRNRSVSAPVSSRSESAVHGADLAHATDGRTWSAASFDSSLWAQVRDGSQDGNFIDFEFDWSLLPE